MYRLFDSIRLVRVGRLGHFRFNAIELSYFINSEDGLAMPFRRTNILSHLFVVPYVLIAEVVFLRVERFYIKLQEHIVGLIVLRNKPERIIIVSLGVAEKYRRSGIATYTLRFTEKVAARLGKEQLELSVLKRNLPAQRLYSRIGFSVAKRTRWSLIMRKTVQESFRKS